MTEGLSHMSNVEDVLVSAACRTFKSSNLSAELRNALSLSCWVIGLKTGSAVRWIEQTSILSLLLPGSAFPRRHTALKHSRTPWQEAATGLLPCSAHLWGSMRAKAWGFHLRPACGFPSTWKKWLIPVRAFAHKGTQMVQLRTVSHSGEESASSVSSKQRPSGQNSETSPVQQKNLRKSKRMLWNPQSGNIFQYWNLEINYFHMLQQMVDLAAVLSVIKPDKLLHDPVDIPRPGGSRECLCLICFLTIFF